MYTNVDRNENDDVSQRFHLLKTRQPTLHEETITTINQEEYTDNNRMTTTTWDKSPIRRVNVISGPQSAFARLFPEKYRRQEEEMINRQRSKSSDHHYSKLNRVTTIEDCPSDDEDDTDYHPHHHHHQKGLRKSRRVRFYNDEDNHLQTRTKSEPYLNEIHGNHEINYDPDPQIIYRDNPDHLIYTQKVGVRYLKPPTPPPSGPLVIREIQPAPPTDPPPLVVSSPRPIPPRTPSPVIVREQPPTPPEYQPPKVITKTLPPPPTPPRRVIIKRMPPLPAKPRPLIIEKWLPYRKTTERPVVYERAEKIQQTRPVQRNVILQYQPPRVQIKQELQNFGCFRVDPETYRAQYGSSLRRTESIRKVLTDIGCDENLITSTGYATCCPSSNNSIRSFSHYDYPRQITTTSCFTDEQLDALLGSSVPTKTTTTTTTIESHYDTPRIYNDDEDYETEIQTAV